MAFGVAEPVTDEAEKERVLGAMVDHIIPGRNAQVQRLILFESCVAAFCCIPQFAHPHPHPHPPPPSPFEERICTVNRVPVQ